MQRSVFGLYMIGHRLRIGPLRPRCHKRVQLLRPAGLDFSSAGMAYNASEFSACSLHSKSKVRSTSTNLAAVRCRSSLEYFCYERSVRFLLTRLCVALAVAWLRVFHTLNLFTRIILKLLIKLIIIYNTYVTIIHN